MFNMGFSAPNTSAFWSKDGDFRNFENFELHEGSSLRLTFVAQLMETGFELIFLK